MSATQHAATFIAPLVEEVALLFPAYDVHALIACGGMGAVYQATQLSLERIVAIKILPREFSTDSEFRKGFEAEAKAMAKLNHPNLIGVYDFGEVDGMLYLVMEYVDGKSLYHSAHGHAVDPSDALRIVSQVCAGLDHAHAAGILHRDIKPSNILLDSTVKPKVGDFGLARALESQIQEGEQIFGTPGYTAPEVLEPPYFIDQRTDVFSVGVMLHELLTAKLPADDPRPVSQLCQCNSRLDAVVQKAINPNPALRYATAGELGAELDKIANAPTSALLTPSSGSSTRSVRKAPSTTPARNIYSPPKYGKYKKDSSSSGVIIVVIILVVGAAIAYTLMSGGDPAPKETGTPKDAAPKSATADVAKTPKPPTNPAPVSETTDRKLDISQFVQKTRGSISGRARPFLERAKSQIHKNTRVFESELAELIQENSGALRLSAEKALKQASLDWKSDGHRIPEALPSAFDGIAGAKELHEEHFVAQTEIEDEARHRVKSQSGIYVLELENQIERSRKTGDQHAINSIEAEISRVKGSESYFRAMIEK